MFEVIKYFIGCDTVSFSHSGFQLIKGYLLSSELNKQVFITVWKSIFQVFSCELLSSMDVLKLTGNRCHNSFDSQKHLELIVCEKFKITIQQQSVPFFKWNV